MEKADSTDFDKLLECIDWPLKWLSDSGEVGYQVYLL